MSAAGLSSLGVALNFRLMDAASCSLELSSPMKLRGNPGLPTAPSPAPSSSLTLAASAAGASGSRRAGGADGVLGMEVTID